jgi:hypothetical protein
MDQAIQHAIETFLLETNALYDTVEVHPGTLIDPPEYMDYCKLCGGSEREHKPECLFYPLFMAM